MTTRKNILVLGVGNLLLSDEGVGIHVAQQLETLSLPANVEVIDGGTGGFELISYFSGRKKVIIIDAVDGDDEPGTILRFTPDDLNIELRPSLSAHQTGIEGLLHFSKELSPRPEVVVIGVIPKETRRLGTSLSKTVKKQIPKAVAAVLKEIGATAASPEEGGSDKTFGRILVHNSS
jgi:hydrogenase maturation protease